MSTPLRLARLPFALLTALVPAGLCVLVLPGALITRDEELLEAVSSLARGLPRYIWPAPAAGR